MTTLGALSVDTTYSLFLGIDRNSATGGKPRRYTTTIASKTQQNIDITSVQAAMTLPSIGGLKGLLFGAGMFVFPTGLPPDWEEQALWMADQWKAGIYAFPDSWRNL
jgi:hypothetical protein